MVIFYKKWKKYNEIQLTKSKMDLNIRKMTNHPPSPCNNNKHNLLVYYKTWKNCNEIQLTKKQYGLEQIENEKHKSRARTRA